MEQIRSNRWSVGCDNGDEPACMGYQSLTTFNRQSEATEAWNKRSGAVAQTGKVPSREQLIRTICGHALCDLQHAQATADAILSLLPAQAICDCGATAEGKWANVHSNECALLRCTAGPTGGRQDARGGVGNAEKAPELASLISAQAVGNPDLLAIYRDIFAEITAKAIPICDTMGNDPERVRHYIVPTGPIHRAAGKLNFQMFDGEAHLASAIKASQKARAAAIEECARICESGIWLKYATQHSPTKSCAIAMRALSRPAVDRYDEAMAAIENCLGSSVSSTDRGDIETEPGSKERIQANITRSLSATNCQTSGDQS